MFDLLKPPIIYSLLTIQKAKVSQKDENNDLNFFFLNDKNNDLIEPRFGKVWMAYTLRFALSCLMHLMHMPQLVSFIGGLYHFKQLMPSSRGLSFLLGAEIWKKILKISFSFFLFFQFPNLNYGRGSRNHVYGLYSSSDDRYLIHLNIFFVI